MAIGYRSISALKAIRLSDKTRSALGDSYAQLSSGQRINKPSTDPGGTAVSLSLRAESKISSRAKLNTEDGVSLASYAESAFDSATDIVQRMNELANQAANGILKTDQRNALNTEFAALREELYRIQKSSSFNGRAVNNGAATASSTKGLGSSVNVGSNDTSADGRYFYWVEQTTGDLKVRDMVTDTTTVLETGLDSSSLISVSAAGDKIAYSVSESIVLLDRLTGQRSTIIPSTSTLLALEISGDGSTVAMLARSYYDENGGGPDGDGGVHLTAYDVPTGALRGDNATYSFASVNNGISLSYNGDYLAIQGEELNVVGEASEVYVFTTSDLANLRWRTTTGNRLIDQFSIDNSGNVYSANGVSFVKYQADNTNGATVLSESAQGFSGGYYYGLTDAGTSITFGSTANLTGENRNGVAQFFKLDLATGVYRQISNYSSNSSAQSIVNMSDDGFSAISLSGTAYTYQDMSPTLNIDVSTGSGLSGMVGVGIVSLDGAARGLKGYSIATEFEAKSAASALTRTLEGLELGRARVGAAVSRLGSASRALAARGTEQQAAYARITDVDTAESVAKLVRLQVLSQAQTAVIAQSSKLVPETALKLLKAA